MEVKTLEGIKSEFQKRIAEHEALASAWEKVERLRKKDGTDFAVLSKNFSNCTVAQDCIRLVPNSKIKVSAPTEQVGWVRDEIDTTELVKYSKIKIEESRIHKEPCIEPYFFKTVDELWEEIQARVKMHRAYADDYRRMIDMAEEKFNFVAERMSDIQKMFNSLGKDVNSLKYALESVVKNWYFPMKF